jgi:hypothetical protein
VGLTGDQDLYESTRVVARGWLERNGRFAPQDELKMSLVDYDRGLGIELLDWVIKNGVGRGSTSKVVEEVLRSAEWSEIAQEFHNELVEEMADRYSERGIYVP